MMVETVKDFQQQGVACPVLVGGAALSNRFTRLRIAPEYGGMVAYASDAMTGLALANTIQEADERVQLAASLEAETEAMLKAASAGPGDSNEAEDVPPARIGHDFPVPNPPDLRLHVLSDYSLEEIFPYINPQMLYVRHLGYKGRFAEALEAGEGPALELRDSVRRVEDLLLAREDIKASAIFKFFPCRSDGQNLLVYSADGSRVLEQFHFGRQSQRDGLCLSDYVRPGPSQGSGGLSGMDYVGMFVTTIGPGVRHLAEQWMREGQFLNAHILQALALEGAESFAEFAAPATAADVGLRRPGRSDLPGPVPDPVPGAALLIRLPCLSQAGGPRAVVPPSGSFGPLGRGID